MQVRLLPAAQHLYRRRHLYNLYSRRHCSSSSGRIATGLLGRQVCSERLYKCLGGSRASHVHRDLAQAGQMGGQNYKKGYR